MAHAYTPGLKVSESLRHRTKRILPLAGEVRVAVGDKVSARDVVAEAFMPGDITPVNLAKMLSLQPNEVPECLLKKQGERVEVGEMLAQTQGLFGLFKQQYIAKVAGTLESISEVTGQIIIRGEPLPLQILAYLTGEVVEVMPSEGVVIEADVSYVQGIFGIGGEAYGPIHLACKSHQETLTEDLITNDMAGAIVVGGARVTGAAIQKAINTKVAAVVSGGMDDQDLLEILGYDLGVAITGSEKIGLTLIITEGFGEIAMAKRTFELFASRQGDAAAVNGATQIRAGVMRPEIVIPGQSTSVTAVDDKHEAGLLEIGAPVRIIRDPHFGIIGTVAELPAERQQLESESKARVLKVALEAGENIIVPRANVELIER